MTPDISSLADGLRTCLQESEEVPTDYTQLFDTHVSIIDFGFLVVNLAMLIHRKTFRISDITLIVLLLCTQLKFLTNDLSNLLTKLFIPSFISNRSAQFPPHII